MRTMIKPVKDIKGFTLVELMIALVIVAIVVTGLISVYRNLSNTYSAEEIKASMQQKARSGMDVMVRDMMMMGFGAETRVLEAQQSYVRFEESILDPATGNYNRYRIKYRISGDSLARDKMDMEDPANPVTTSILLDNVASLTFEYFNEYNAPLGNPTISYAAFEPDWDDAVPASQSTTPGACQYNRELIRRITITLVVNSDRPIPGITDEHGNPKIEYKQITLKADISPRNLWETTNPEGGTAPVWGGDGFTGYSTAQYLYVRDTHECGKLKVRWQRSASIDLAGYLVKYGTAADALFNYKDVPAIPGSTDDPVTEITGIDVSKYTETPVNYYFNVQAYDTAYNYTPLMPVSVYGTPYANNTSFDVSEEDSTNSVPKPAALSVINTYNSYAAGANYDVNCPEGGIVLIWTPPSDTNVVGYRIYRSETAFSSYPPDESLMIARETDEGGAWAGAVTDRGGSSGGSANDANLTQAWGYTDGRFVDRGVNADGTRTELVGCQTYYYTICLVTCDTTRIYGFGPTDLNRYDNTQFADASGKAYETTPPSAPGIAAAEPGWKRVLLQMTWPTSDEDYSRTEVYFKQGAYSADLADYTLIPHYDTVSTLIDPATGVEYATEAEKTGKFYNHGTYGNNLIVFNSEDSPLPYDAVPELAETGVYSFVAIAYDKCNNPSDATSATGTVELCGDEPCGPPLWLAGVTPRLWVDASTTNLDASTWDPTDITNTQIDIGFRWTDIEPTHTDAGGNLDTRSQDFRTYVLSSALYGADPNLDDYTESIEVAYDHWVVSTGHTEGQAYNYRLQAADCVWASNVGGVGPGADCSDPDTGAVTASYTPSEVWGSRSNGTDGRNITQFNDIQNTWGLFLPNIRPGKFRQYIDDTTNSYKEFAYTQGDFHNEVVFYLQNTSRAPLEVEKVAFDWSNELNVKLGSITFANYSGSPDPEQSYPANAVAQQYISINRPITEVADIAAGTPSEAIKVVLTFINDDVSGTVDEFTDMRGAVVKWEIQFKNHSMPNSAISDPVTGPFVGGFTTGYIHDITDPADPTVITHQANPRTFKVLAGPSVNSVLQDRPDNPTASVAVTENNLTDPTLPPLPEVDGRADVQITANVTKPSADTIESVSLKVFLSDPTATNVSGATELDPIDMTVTSGSDYQGTIPGADDKGVWFYIYAVSLQGQTSVRDPLAANSYYYYKQLPFDVCTVNPSPPNNLATNSVSSGLGDLTVTFTWDPPADYSNGVAIDSGDTLVYDLYRRPIGAAYTAPFATGITGTTHSITLTSLDTTTYIYAAKARNSCATETRESGISNEAIICRASGCTIQLTPSVVVDTDWTAGSETATPKTASLAVFICERANDDSWWNYGPGFDSATGDFIDNGFASLSHIAMTVEPLTSAGANTTINLFEINDTGVFTMTGTQDTRIFIDPTVDVYDNNPLNTSPVPSTNRTMRTFGATSINALEDTLTFMADTTDCVAVSATMDVTTDPCANTPQGTTILSGTRSASNFVTLVVDEVTQNTDGSPATNATDGITYEAWYTNVSAAARLLNATVTDNGNGTVTIAGDLTLSAGETNDSFDFYVVVTDNCTSPDSNESVQSNIATMFKNSSF